jgi:NAD(P)-dependent dehydrogenase (short-subunit alcohol dehydrogenase family)
MIARRRLLAATLGLLAPCLAAPAALASTDPGTPAVLITGASRGIGLELARQYAARGWHVIATARKPADAPELVKLAEAHANVMLEPLDVTDFAQIDALAAKYRDRPIDVLINNAGISGPVPSQLFGRMDYAVFRDVLETNTVGPMRLAEALAGNVEASAQRKIVTISSSEASFATIDAPRLYWYRASKAAVNMLMLNLAFQLKPRGITVAIINPGPVDTDFMKGVRMPLQPPAVAVGKVIGLIDRASLETTGTFLDYEGGVVPW